MTPFELKPEDAAQAALHALHALDADAARAFEVRVDDEPALEAELLALRKVADALAPLAPEVEPPPALLQRVLGAVRGEGSAKEATAKEATAKEATAKEATAKEATANAEVTPFTAVVQDTLRVAVDDRGFFFRDEGAFKPLKLPGITARTLHVDNAAGYATVIVRMQPGASYPAHRHGDDEECYVLEGDLQVGEQTMQAGDYQVARRGSVHPLQVTKSGCLLLLRSSLHDELLEAV